jgi:hypothetical protein
MKTYKVSFVLNNKVIETTITARDYSSALALVKAQYPAAKSVNVSEMR